MFYLSQVIGKPLIFKNQPSGRVIDLIAAERKNIPTADSLLVKSNNKRFSVLARDVNFNDGKWIVTSNEFHKSPIHENSFFLNEDLLDKQVIDINGKRLVRVNDVVLKENGELKVEGIDIGFSGIIRRLGLPNFLGLKTITLPWKVIEAFDYETGTIRIKLTHSRLNTFHPAEIAEILEEVGTKERLGILESLDTQHAALAIEEANDETQSAILEQVSSTKLKSIVGRMHLSEIADVLKNINPFTGKQILSSLGKEKAKKLQKLLIYEDDKAGGLMEVSFFKESGDTKVGDLFQKLSNENIKPESIIITDSSERLVGTINIRDLINKNHETPLKVVEMFHSYVEQDASFSEILRQFAHYNIRTLPVTDENKKVVGIIKIDNILTKLHEEEERDDAI